MERSASVALDEAQVAMTRDLFGTLYAAALATWQESTLAATDRLARAIAAGDLDETREAAHAIRGSALSMGAAQVADLALTLEQTATLPAPEVVAQLDDVVGRTASALAADS